MKKNTLLIEAYLDELFPKPICELNYNKDYELLISVMLSAQTTDRGVNKVTKQLYTKYDNLEKLRNASLYDLENIIKPIGSYHRKAASVIKIAESLLVNFQGVVPKTHKELESMSGVGRKSANVVLAELFDIPSFAVDTHVIRVSNRLGLVKTEDPLKIEKSLKKQFAKENWNKLHKQFVLFGRYHCKAKNPSCKNCKLKDNCNYVK